MSNWKWGDFDRIGPWSCGPVFANNAHGTLAKAITATDTELTLEANDSDRFPYLGDGGFGGSRYFWITVADGLGNSEIMVVVLCYDDKLTIGRAGDDLGWPLDGTEGDVVGRAQEGTTARAFPAGSTVNVYWTVGLLRKLQEDAHVTADKLINGVPDDYNAYMPLFGEEIVISWTPTNYTPAINTTQGVGYVDTVGGHLVGIGNRFGQFASPNGDRLDVDFTPSNYTPDNSPAEASDVDDLASHLKGIDNQLGWVPTAHAIIANVWNTNVEGFSSNNTWQQVGNLGWAEIQDPSGIVSLGSANLFTLSAGKYHVRACKRVHEGSGMRLRLYNNTAGGRLLLGLSAYSSDQDGESNDPQGTLLEVSGVFTVAAGQELSLDLFHRSTAIVSGQTITDDSGTQTETNYTSWVEITKLQA